MGHLKRNDQYGQSTRNNEFTIDSQVIDLNMERVRQNLNRSLNPKIVKMQTMCASVVSSPDRTQKILNKDIECCLPPIKRKPKFTPVASSLKL